MCFPELRPVAFIKNEHDALILEFPHPIQKMFLADCGIEFLNGGYN
jgi:hypothetical protein